MTKDAQAPVGDATLIVRRMQLPSSSVLPDTAASMCRSARFAKSSWKSSHLADVLPRMASRMPAPCGSQQRTAARDSWVRKPVNRTRWRNPSLGWHEERAAARDTWARRWLQRR